MKHTAALVALLATLLHQVRGYHKLHYCCADTEHGLDAPECAAIDPKARMYCVDVGSAGTGHEYHMCEYKDKPFKYGKVWLDRWLYAPPNGCRDGKGQWACAGADQ